MLILESKGNTSGSGINSWVKFPGRHGVEALEQPGSGEGRKSWVIMARFAYDRSDSPR